MCLNMPAEQRIDRSSYPKTGIHYDTSRRTVGEMLHLFFNIQKQGIENLDTLAGKPAVFVYFPHTGMGDILIAQHVLCESGITNLFVQGAEDYWFHNPRKLLLANLVTPIFPLPRQTVDPSVGMDDIQDAMSLQIGLINNDKLSVLLSPEGTRSNLPADKRTVHSGFAQLALQTQVPVVPIIIAGYENVLPKGTSIPHFLKFTGLPHPDYRQRVGVVIGEPIDTTGFEDNSSSRKALTAQAKKIFLKTYDAIHQ